MNQGKLKTITLSLQLLQPQTLVERTVQTQIHYHLSHHLFPWHRFSCPTVECRQTQSWVLLAAHYAVKEEEHCFLYPPHLPESLSLHQLRINLETGINYHKYPYYIHIYSINLQNNVNKSCISNLLPLLHSPVPIFHRSVVL